MASTANKPDYGARAASALALHAQGQSIEQIALSLNLSVRSITRSLRLSGLSFRRDRVESDEIISDMYQRGETYASIAQRTGLSSGQVWSDVARAREEGGLAARSGKLREREERGVRYCVGKCKAELPLSEFGGKNLRCRACMRESAREYRVRKMATGQPEQTEQPEAKP